jgi:hypothetical protein
VPLPLASTWRAQRLIPRILLAMDRLPTGGVLLGLLFFALSLTPSLLPRHFILQGVPGWPLPIRRIGTKPAFANSATS